MGELSLIFPDRSPRDIEAIARKSFTSNLKRHMETLVYGSLDRHWYERHVSFSGLANLDAALSKGRGAIILLQHFGSFLLIPAALGFRGYQVAQLTGRPELNHHRTVHQRISAIRMADTRSLPVTFLIAANSLKTAFLHLKAGGCLAWAFDGRTGSTMIPVTLFGRTALVSSGPVRTSLTTGAPIVPAFIIRQKNDYHTLIIEPCLDPSSLEGPRNKAVETGTGMLAARFEHYLTACPDHYAMILAIMRARAERGIIETALIEKPGSGPCHGSSLLETAEVRRPEGKLP